MSEHTEIPFNLELARKTDEYEIVHSERGVCRFIAYIPDAIIGRRVLVMDERGGRPMGFDPLGQNSAGERALTLHRKSKKCLVLGCPNRTDQGKFVGDLCFPCHRILTTGEVGPTDGILKNLRRAEPDSIPFNLELARKTDEYEIVHNVYDECRLVAHVPDGPEESRVVVLALHPPKLLTFAENGYCSESSRIFLRRKR